MANEEHLTWLKQGVVAWNQWRSARCGIQPNLSGADLTRVDLRRANLIGVDLSGAKLSEVTLNGVILAGADLRRARLTEAHLREANLRGANLASADLSRADLREAALEGANLTGALLVEADLADTRLCGANLASATLIGADLREANLADANLTSANLGEARLSDVNLAGADLSGADLWRARLNRANLFWALLTNADLSEANLTQAKLTQADLGGAKLMGALLVETKLEDANLTRCLVYGISAWNVSLIGAQQLDLCITHPDEPVITVDNLEVAQFIYLLLRNEKIRHVIETITSKAVLILGRFTPERKAVLDALREELRKRDRLPILFDFTAPTGPTLLETVSTLAHMARFIIADLTDAKSVLQELQAIVPNNPSVPVQPILLASQEEPGMFDFIRRFPWVLETYAYHSLDDVLASLEQIIARADKARVPSDMGKT